VSEPIAETIHWHAVADELPDDDTTVLLNFDNADPWPGWHEDGQWLDASGMPVEHVTHWADMPGGPPCS
jgi:hypothetical protein